MKNIKVRKYIVKLKPSRVSAVDQLRPVEFRSRGHAWQNMDHAPEALKGRTFYLNEVSGLREVGRKLFIGEVTIKTEYTRQALYYQRLKQEERAA